MKFLNTNLTIENFVSGLRNSSANLSETLNKWSELDAELREEYLQQLTFLLEKSAEFIEKENKKEFWCQGCGEPRYKCYCDEDCPHCGKKLIVCTAESNDGWCPQDPNIDRLRSV